MKLRISLVGFGFMGQMHALVYRTLKAQGREVEISCVVDSFPETPQKMAELGIEAPCVASLEEALRSFDSNIVDICLPTDLHAAHIQTAAHAKKHIFCEKPLALTLEEAQSALDAVEKNKVVLQVGHCIRFWPEYQALREFVASKQAGPLRRLSLLRRAARPRYSRDGWLDDVARSKGAALDLHIHDTDFVLSLLGMPRGVHSLGRKEETYLSTHYLYDDMTVTAEGGWDLPPCWGFQMAFQAVFANAVIDYDSLQSPTLRLTRGEEAPQALPFTKPEIGSAGKSSGNISDLGGYYNELAYFCDRLAAGQKPEIATGRQALESLRVTLAEIESAEQKIVISF
jgi:predicted dehydrogenase